MKVAAVLRTVQELAERASANFERGVSAFDDAIARFGGEPPSHVARARLVPAPEQLDLLETAEHAAKSALADLEEGARLVAEYDPRGVRASASLKDAIAAARKLHDDASAVRNDTRRALAGETRLEPLHERGVLFYSDAVAHEHKHGQRTYYTRHSVELMMNVGVGFFRQRIGTPAVTPSVRRLPGRFSELVSLDEPHRTAFFEADQRAQAALDDARTQRAALLASVSSDADREVVVAQLVASAVRRDGLVATALEAAAASMYEGIVDPRFHGHVAAARAATTAALEELDDAGRLLTQSQAPRPAALATLERARTTIARRLADADRADRGFFASQQHQNWGDYQVRQSFVLHRRRPAEYKPDGDRTVDASRLAQLARLDEPLAPFYAARTDAYDTVTADAVAARSAIMPEATPIEIADAHARLAHGHQQRAHAALTAIVDTFAQTATRDGHTVVASPSQLANGGRALAAAEAAHEDLQLATAAINDVTDMPRASAELAESARRINGLLERAREVDIVLRRTVGTGQTTYKHGYTGGINYHSLWLSASGDPDCVLRVNRTSFQARDDLAQLSALDHG